MSTEAVTATGSVARVVATGSTLPSLGPAGVEAAFDFWVVEHHLRAGGEDEAIEAGWRVAGEGRLHDPMLLDVLVRLARDDSFPVPRNLAAVARATTGLEVTKDDPYRTRYG